MIGQVDYLKLSERLRNPLSGSLSGDLLFEREEKFGMAY